MNTGWAVGIAMIIISIFAVDHYYLHWNLPVVVGTNVIRILDSMAFWR